jgi:hypothetical protein
VHAKEVAPGIRGEIYKGFQVIVLVSQLLQPFKCPFWADKLVNEPSTEATRSASNFSENSPDSETNDNPDT